LTLSETDQKQQLNQQEQSHQEEKNTIPIRDIIIKERYRKEFGDINTLADNIKNVGLLQPIVINNVNNELVDGQRRILAFESLGRTDIPCFKVDLQKIVLGEFSANHYRKDWTYSEMVSIKRAIEPYEKNKAQERKLAGKLCEESSQGDSKDNSGKSRERVAGFVGISHDTLKKAEKIVNASEEEPQIYQPLLDKMNSKKISVNKAYKILEKEKAKKILFNKLKEEKPKLEIPDRCKLILGDLSVTAEENSISNNSIDLIFTDPPYSTDSIYIYSELASLANRVLKPGGSIVTYIGQHNLLEILNIFTSNNLKYWWPIAVKHTGATKAFHQRKVFVLWKPLLWFIKGDKLSESYPITALNDYLYDYVESKPPEKLLHPWEQSPVEAEHIIKKLTMENQLVLDPLMGSGTTGIAALNLKRRFIGIEKDQEKFIIAEARLTNHILNNNTTSANIDLISDATKVKEENKNTISSFDEQNNLDRR
jgi:DNA modification methylase